MINIDKTTKEPLYIQIYKSIKKSIIQKNIKMGTKLPSKRKLSKQLSVSINTIDTAYSQLVSEGFIKSIPKSGFYVCDIKNLDIINFNQKKYININFQKEEENKNLLDFSLYGIDKSSFPYTTWKKLIREVLNLNAYDFLKISPTEGEKSLREVISNQIYLRRGIVASSDRIIIGAGTDNLIEIINSILKKDCKIAMEDPTYINSYNYFKRMGHNIISVETDEYGISIENIKDMENIVVYITPSHQFPLGITMPINRRLEILKWVKQGKNRYIIEDDYDSEFRYDSKPIPALHSIDNNDNVIYLGSFSRSISPTLRISYLIIPEKLINIYKNNYKNTSCAVSKLEQLILEKFISYGHYETHINKMRKIYSEKREFIIKELKYHFKDNIIFFGENAGYHIIFKIKNINNELELYNKLLLNNVKIYLISDFFNNKINEKFKNSFIAGYGSLSFEEIRKGIEIIKNTILK